MEHPVFSFCWGMESITEYDFNESFHLPTQLLMIDHVDKEVGSVETVSRILSVFFPDLFLISNYQAFNRWKVKFDGELASAPGNSCGQVHTPIMQWSIGRNQIK